jgi:acyl-coenzyme A synthetase/AMP-(fatty) acid ligase
VYDAAVVPVAHPVKGQVPDAMVMRQAGAAITEAALKQYFLENGPASAHPRLIRLVEEMPLSGAAKVDRTRVLRELEAAFSAELAEAS